MFINIKIETQRKQSIMPIAQKIPRFFLSAEFRGVYPLPMLLHTVNNRFFWKIITTHSVNITFFSWRLKLREMKPRSRSGICTNDI